MEFTNRFHIPLPLEESWGVMLDIPRILPCLPGATLKEVRDENIYLGSVSVKLGPIRLSFDGQAELVRQDAEQHIAWLKGSGLDPKGRGAAQSEFSFALIPAAAGGTDVTVTTQLQLSGAVAQYGRGSGMIAQVATHILKQFEENLAALLQGDTTETTSAIDTVLAHGATDVTPVMPSLSSIPSAPPLAIAPASITPSEAQAVLLQVQAVLAQTQALLAASQQVLLQVRQRPGKTMKPKELKLLRIGMQALWSQCKALFSRRSKTS